MKKIALLNLKGGCGATTIAANLADTLSTSNKTWLWQTDDFDQLSLHFGQSIQESIDWKYDMQQMELKNILAKIWLEDSPFTFFSTSRQVAHHVIDVEHGQHVKVLLNSLNYFNDKGEVSYSIIHFPIEFHRIENIDELTKLVDLVIVVGVADAQTYQRLNILSNTDNGFINKDNVKLLINKFNPEISIENDMYTVISDEFSDQIIPDPIFNSPEFLEAAANMVTVKSYANKSFAYENVFGLALWCKEWLKVNTRHG